MTHNGELERRYAMACRQRCDINEHCPTLSRYAAQCGSVLELGVRSGVSSWALMHGLLKSQESGEKRHVAVDLARHANVNLIAAQASRVGIKYEFKQGNDLQVEIEPTDLTFIDTWHVYGHLKRELARFAPLTGKFILMHDTEVDAERGETVRCLMHEYEAQLKNSGLSKEEILCGLRPAIEEFLAEHPEWKLLEKFRNNNGLTVLHRVSIA